MKETSFRSKPIEKADTSTTAFIGPTQKGPIAPSLVSSFAEFEHLYGGLHSLRVGGIETPNYIAHAARAYFREGGLRLYIVRVSGGADGHTLTVDDYLGEKGNIRTGLAALDEFDDVSIVAAPGAMASQELGREVMHTLVDHVARHGFRFAVPDPVPPIYSICGGNLGIIHRHRIPFPACINSSKSSPAARRST